MLKFLGAFRHIYSLLCRWSVPYIRAYHLTEYYFLSIFHSNSNTNTKRCFQMYLYANKVSPFFLCLSVYRVHKYINVNIIINRNNININMKEYVRNRSLNYCCFWSRNGFYYLLFFIYFDKLIITGGKMAQTKIKKIKRNTMRLQPP